MHGHRHIQLWLAQSELVVGESALPLALPETHGEPWYGTEKEID
jgi:hypothetical protein